MSKTMTYSHRVTLNAMAKRSTLIANLDRWFSKYMRLKYAVNGKVSCYTCGVVKDWKSMQNGHFQTRAKYSVRWHESNTRPQCPRCNISNGGRQYEFGLRLNEEKPGLADEMVRLGNQTRKFTNQEILELTAKYRDLTKRLLDA